MSASTIVLYQTDWCPFCARVREGLDRLGLAYDIVNVPDAHQDRTVVRELFGVTGVPSLVDGDVKIADDDDAILAYLNKTYGAPKP